MNIRIYISEEKKKSHKKESEREEMVFKADSGRVEGSKFLK